MRYCHLHNQTARPTHQRASTLQAPNPTQHSSATEAQRGRKRGPVSRSSSCEQKEPACCIRRETTTSLSPPQRGGGQQGEGTECARPDPQNPKTPQKCGRGYAWVGGGAPGGWWPTLSLRGRARAGHELGGGSAPSSSTWAPTLARGGSASGSSTPAGAELVRSHVPNVHNEDYVQACNGAESRAY